MERVDEDAAMPLTQRALAVWMRLLEAAERVDLGRAVTGQPIDSESDATDCCSEPSSSSDEVSTGGEPP